MPKAKAKKWNISQRARFIEAARELGTDQDEAVFDAKLKFTASQEPKLEREKPPDK